MSKKIEEHTIAETLEACIDNTSLAEVIETIASICYEKANHVRTSYQDDVTANSWVEDALKLDCYFNN